MLEYGMGTMNTNGFTNSSGSICAEHGCDYDEDFIQ